MGNNRMFTITNKDMLDLNIIIIKLMVKKQKKYVN